MIYTVTLNAALDKTVLIRDFAVGALNRAESVYVEAGGKGINVAKAIRSLDCSCVAMGFLGGGTGDTIEERLRTLGIECDFVRVAGETRTNIKIMDPVERTVTEVNECGTPVSPELLELLESKLLSRVVPGDTVILSGSVPPGVDEGIYAKWIALLRDAGAATMLDADGALFRRGVDAVPSAVKPNLSEMIGLCGKRLPTVGDIGPQARVLLQKGIETVLVSMGADGALLFCEQGAWHAPALPVEVKSTVGAGDTMVAAWAVARAVSMPPREMLRLAAAAAGATVMTGTAGRFPGEMIGEFITRVKINPYTGK